MVTEEKQVVIDAVIEQLKKDFEVGDYTVLDELLGFVPINNLIHSLPEEEWPKYDKMETIVVSKSAKELRIEEEYQNALSAIKDLTKKGFDDFTLTIRGDYGEASEVCSKLEYFGVHVCERGFDHRGFGPSAYANVHFEIR